MERVRVFLRTELFTLRGGNGHVPVRTVIVEGALSGSDGSTPSISGGLLVQVDSYFDATGQPLVGAPTRLWLPASKVDHVLVVAEE